MNKKKIFSVLLSLAMLGSIITVPALAENYADEENGSAVELMSAASGTCGDNLTWTLDSSGTLTISGTGDMINSDFPWSKSEIFSLKINSGVTSIGDFAFSGCENLKNIEISAGVTSIGQYAFNDCSEIESIVLPEGVENIGESLFKGCVSLKNVTLPSTLKKIGNSMFSDCAALKSIDIPEGTETIGSLAFNRCGALEQINIPSTVGWINSDAFSGGSGRLIFTVNDRNEKFSALDEVLFNKDKTEIIKYGKDKLQQKYRIPDGVANMGAFAFYGCSELTDLYIPASVGGYGSPTFSHCGKLYITVDPDNPKLSSQNGILYNKDKTTLIKCANDIYTLFRIPNTVTNIYGSVFSGCEKLTDVYVPESVKSIGAHVFDDCENIYYAGTEEQWKNIEISSYGNPITAEIHYGWIENCFEILGGTVTNTDTNNEHSALIIIARYENGVMKEIKKCNTVTFGAGAQEQFSEYEQDCKIFVWDSFNGIRPLNKSSS